MSSPNDANSEMDQAAMEHDATGNEVLDHQVADQHMVADVCGDNEEVVHDDAGNQAAENDKVSEGDSTGNKPVAENQRDDLKGYASPNEEEIQVLNEGRAKGSDVQRQEPSGKVFSIKMMENAIPLCSGEYNSFFGDMIEIDGYFKWSHLFKLGEDGLVINCEEWIEWARENNLPPEYPPPDETRVKGDVLLLEAGLHTEPEDLEVRGETVYEANRLGLFMHKKAYIDEIGKYVTLKGLSLHSPTTLYLNPSLGQDNRANRAPWITSVLTMWDTYHALEIGLEQRSGFLVQSQGEGLWPLERVWVVEGPDGDVVPIKKRPAPKASGQQETKPPSGSETNLGKEAHTPENGSPRDFLPPRPTYNGARVQKGGPRGFDPQRRFNPRGNAPQGGGRGRGGGRFQSGKQQPSNTASGNYGIIERTGGFNAPVSQVPKQVGL